MRLMGVNINTIVKDNVAIRCDGCLEIIDGTPVAAEHPRHRRRRRSPISAAERGAINPGPFQFHGDPTHVKRWMADNGYWFCRRSEVREIMRPIPLPGPGDSDAVGPLRRHPSRRPRVRSSVGRLTDVDRPRS